MKFGVCIVALGYDIYGSYALNLAISLKVYDQDVKIALLCDTNAIQRLNETEKEFFDHIIFIPESDYTIDGKKEFMRMKLMVSKYTPFTHNIYLDADNLWFDKKISWLFGQLHTREFMIGYNAHFDVKTGRTTKIGYTYWCRDENECVKYHGIENIMPQTVSGFYYFEKNARTETIFDTALKVFDDKSKPSDLFAGGCADEYCFNVALGKLNYTQQEFNPIYFDKIHGAQDGKDIYQNFWAIAPGGSIVSKAVKKYYDRLATKYAIMAGLKRRHVYSSEDVRDVIILDKTKVIPERKKN